MGVPVSYTQVSSPTAPYPNATRPDLSRSVLVNTAICMLLRCKVVVSVVAFTARASLHAGQ